MMSAFKNVVCILFTYFLILSTLFILCGQVVNKLSSVDKFIVFSIFDNLLFYKGLRGYLPQQFLYFLPDPHGLATSVFIVLFVFIILLVFQLFQNQVTSILFVLSVLINIINIYYPWTNCGHCPHPFTAIILLYNNRINKYAIK